MAVLLLLLCWSLTVWAQPEAPVSWGEARWLNVVAHNMPGRLAMSGDTLAIVDEHYNAGDPATWSIATTVSTDNGVSFSPWAHLDSVLYREEPDIYVSATPGRIGAFLQTRDRDAETLTSYVRISTDGGATWGPRLNPTNYGWYSGMVVGDQILTVMRRSGPYVEWLADFSPDGERRWQRDYLEHAELYIYPYCLAATCSNFIAIGVQGEERYAATGSRSGEGDWSDFELLPRPVSLPFRSMTTVTADPATDDAVVLLGQDHGHDTEMHLFAVRSSNGGRSWQEPVLLSEGHPSGQSNFSQIFCTGRMVGVAWMDADNPDLEQRGLYCRVSANHGKSWFPPQRVDTQVRWGLLRTTGQFVSREARLYWVCTRTSRTEYRAVTGILDVDTLAPLVEPFELPGPEVDVGDTARFWVRILEDRELYPEVTLHVWQVNTGETVTVPLRWLEADEWEATYVVPEAGYYRYRIHSEDLWENGGDLPTSGWYRFTTPGWLAAEERPAPAAMLRIAVSPNPMNSTARIRLDLPQSGPAIIDVFDLQGRRVDTLYDGFLAAGAHELTWSGDGCASGLYFLRAQLSGQVYTHRLLLLK